ncbi:23S rRNA (guanosine(2251)-2'-O)-methyltransferase RlmB [Vagococcus sp.]|uniref:23S rRNA (guanosine(2251)-2'-O)-methyltransferase RlmB n=1 Tax=Vagococcus sp. TaxID=1933889 RepID=UPI002FCB9FB1
MKNKRERSNEVNEPVSMEDVVFGKHATIEALQARRGNKLFIQEDLKSFKIEELKELAKEFSVPIVWAPKTRLDEMTNKENHQGIVLKITPYEYLSLEDLLAKSKEKENRFFLILDSIMDPHNLGSIMRTADAVNVDGIIIPKHRAVGITPVVVKTSTGAVEHVPVARVTNLSQTIKKLKEDNVWVFGTDMEGTDYTKWNVAGDIALVIGNEGKGIGSALKKEMDEMITIPIDGHVQSLNAGVAAGLLMYEVHRKRRD